MTPARRRTARLSDARPRRGLGAAAVVPRRTADPSTVVVRSTTNPPSTGAQAIQDGAGVPSGESTWADIVAAVLTVHGPSHQSRWRPDWLGDPPTPNRPVLGPGKGRSSVSSPRARQFRRWHLSCSWRRRRSRHRATPLRASGSATGGRGRRGATWARDCSNSSTGAWLSPPIVYGFSCLRWIDDTQCS